MSRLRVLHIPFVSGVDDRVDAKVLPDGLFADLRNARFNKAGQLALRRGWRPVDMSETVANRTLFARDLYSYNDSLVALVQAPALDNSLHLATFNEANSTRPWRFDGNASSSSDQGRIPPLTEVRQAAGVPDQSGNLVYSCYAVTADGTYGCAMHVYAGSSRELSVIRVFRIADDETLAYSAISSGGSANLQLDRVFALGNTFGMVSLVGTDLQYYTLDPTTTNPAFSLVQTLEVGVTAGSPFDVAVARDSTPTHLHVVTTAGGAVTYRRYDLGGIQSGADKTIVAAGVTTGAAIYCDDTTAHVIYKLDATNVAHLLSFASTGAYATTAGPTALFDSTALSDARLCVTETGGTVWAAGEADIYDTHVSAFNASTHVGLSYIFRSHALVAGFIVRAPYVGLGLTRIDEYGTATGGTFLYSDIRMPWVVAQHGLANRSTSAIHPPIRPGQSQSTHVLFGGLVKAGSFHSPVTYSCSVLATARRPAYQAGEVLYLTGGVLTEWAGTDLVENGMLAPVIRSLTESNTASGALTATGEYSYRAVLTWYDERRGKHRSIVSAPRDITLTGANDTVTAVVDVSKTLRRNGDTTTNPRVELYRTEAGPGELFYLTASGFATTSTDSTTVVDPASDAALIDNERLYTEGEFGAVSGMLDITPAAPSEFAAATRQRLILAGDSATFQASQIQLPEEPVSFSQPGVSGPIALSYFGTIAGRINGLAALDDTIIAGTADQLFVSGGPGPNLAGLGEFEPVARLPADVGFYSQASILEAADGLWFLGSATALYLLPRGQGVPTHAGLAVQDRFSGNVVGAGRDSADNILAWATSAATAVVRAQDAAQWSVDPLPFTPVAFVGHRGRLYGVATDGVVWAQEAAAYGDGAAGATAVALQVVTGDVQVFGQGGHGRLATIEVLGEYQAAAAVLVEASYDLGLTWTSLGSHTISGLSAGQAWQRQWYPARQRGGKFRLRLTMTPASTTTEGCRLAGFSVYFDQRSGPTRLDSAKRR